MKIVSEKFIEDLFLNRNGKKIAYVSGAFDIVHAGHVQYLQEAKKCADLLVIRLNSDQSIKNYKDERRPINDQNARAVVLAGLSSVDYVFISDDLDNTNVIKKLKPDFYVKSMDNFGKLKSAEIVESYGGKVVYIDMKDGYSSTNIVNKVLEIYGYWKPEIRKMDNKPAIFLDRDGTIVKEINYLHEPEKVELLPGITKKLLELQKDFYIIIVTNQPGIGFGYFTKEDFFRTNLQMLKLLSKDDVKVDKIYYCPHTQSVNCNCRKPNTLMFDKAFEDLPIIKEKSYMFGDSLADMKVGKKLNLKTVLINSEKNDGGSEYADLIVDNWNEFNLF